MFFVAGITGKVGGAAARQLLADGHEVRSLVRDRAKAAEWSEKGVELREGSLVDGHALAEALRGVDGAFLMQPTPMAVSPDFPEARALNAAIVEALRRSAPPRLVVLSSVGSEQASGLGNITQTHMLEEALANFASPIAIVRAGSLMESFLGSLERAGETGVFDSFLQPVDRAFPMVATQDVGAEVARLLTGQAWEGRRIIEVGSHMTPDEVATGMAKALGRDVVAKPLPRERWDAAISAMRVPSEKAGNWAAMEEGFNSGWIDFGRAGTEAVAAATTPAMFFARSG